jgi:hypothetical protein
VVKWIRRQNSELLFIVRRADTSKIPIEKPAVFHTSSTAGTGIIPRAEPKGNVPRTDPDAGTQGTLKLYLSNVKFEILQRSLLDLQS